MRRLDMFTRDMLAFVAIFTTLAASYALGGLWGVVYSASLLTVIAWLSLEDTP